MSVQSHLDQLASKLVLKSSEEASIVTSINTIAKRLDMYFNTNLINHYKFGSYTRGTILPRKVDQYSDIDYMVIFKNPNKYKPQTLLNNLKDFVNYYYSSSEIYQSYPTIVLELKHIKFELVPAQMDLWGNIEIPSPSSSYYEWMNTDPVGFNSKLTTSNTNNNYKIKPLIRLMKYWNSLNGYCYSSYLLEKWIVENFYYNCHNIKDYLYCAFDKLTYNYSDSQSLKGKIDRAKKIIENVKSYESNQMPYTAEMEIKKLLPDF